MDAEVKELLATAFEILRQQQQQLFDLYGSVRALYVFAHERDPGSSLDLDMKSSEYKKHASGGYNAAKLKRLDELLRELKK